MKVKYTCLKNLQKGFVLTRKPEIVNKELGFGFLGAPLGATAIFENGEGNVLYRVISNKGCTLPLDFLVGEIKITVTLLDGRTNPERITCEPIYAEREKNGVLVYPNWLDLPMQIIEIYRELENTKENITEVVDAQRNTNKRVEKLLDGYDFD